MMQNIYFISLGCPKNLVDSNELIDLIAKTSFSIVDIIDNANIVIINTCGFINDAKQEAVEEILKVVEIKNQRPIKIIVFGCLVQRYEKELLKDIPEVDYFFGVNSKRKIINVLKSFSVNKSKSTNQTQQVSLPHIGYLKISEGCSNRCSYCAIPYIRGPYKSVPKKQIFNNLKLLLKKGAKEIVLVGQDTSLYGKDIYKNYFLADLLNDISDKCKRDIWIRLLYTHPAHLDKQVLNVISQKKNICKYIDLPLQQINDNILSKMKRRVKKNKIIKLIELIKSYNIAIRTSFIVGFPGETNKEFKELLDFIKDVEFDRLGVFTYSKEEGTPAVKYEGGVRESAAQNRLQKIMEVQQGISRKKNNKLVGTKLEVIIDEEKKEKGSKGSLLVGRTRIDAPDIDCLVFMDKKRGINVGEIVTAKIIQAYEYDLIGEIQ